MWSRRALDPEFSLNADFINRGLVGELRDELIGLDVDILLPEGRLGCFDVSCEKFLGGAGSLLFKLLRVVFFLVSLEKLIGVGSSRDDHRGISGSTENSSVIHDVLGHVLLLWSSATVGIFVLLFTLDNARCCSETVVLIRAW